MASAKENAVQISEPRVEEHPAMVVAGVSRVFSLDEDFSPLWDELNQKASPAMLDVLNVTQYLGVCTQPNPKGQVRYTAGFLVSEPASAAKLGLGVLELPASTYAVVEVTGPISESIPAGFASFEEAFFVAVCVPRVGEACGWCVRRKGSGALCVILRNKILDM